MVFTADYSAEMLASARESAELYRAGFVTVQGIEELFRYLNQGKDRKQSPIEHLALFSHGVPQRIAFGHELADALVDLGEQIAARRIQRVVEIEDPGVVGHRSTVPLNPLPAEAGRGV